MIKKCLNCQKEFKQPKGTREKIYCSDLCRASYNQKMKTTTVDLNKYFDNDIRKEVFNDLFETGVLITKTTDKGIEYIKSGSKEWFDILFSKIPKTKIQNLNQTTNELKNHEQKETNYTINTEQQKNDLQRIKDLEEELKHPPKNPIIGMSKWLSVRYNELKQLKEKYGKEN